MEKAFSDCGSLTKIVIGDGVTEIGEEAFYRCISLHSITLSDSLQSIGSNAFYYCIRLALVRNYSSLMISTYTGENPGHIADYARAVSTADIYSIEYINDFVFFVE